MQPLMIFALGGAIAGMVTVELPDGREMEVINDLSVPFAAAHELQVNYFLGSPGQGFGRMYRHVPGVHGHLNPGPLHAWAEDSCEIEITCFELLGIVRSPAPRVYLTNTSEVLAIHQAWAREVDEKVLKEAGWRALAAKDLLGEPVEHLERGRGSKVGVRPTDAFENHALAQLRAGHALAVMREGSKVRAVGAIRASESCLQCHESSKPGDLLGAFTYVAEEKPHRRPVSGHRWTEAFQQDKEARKKSGETKPAKVTATDRWKEREAWRKRIESPDDSLTMRRRVEEMLQSDTPPSDEQLWKAVDDKPRAQISSAQELDLKLASLGLIRPRLISTIQDQRADLESQHLSGETRDKLRGWYHIKKPQ